MVDVSAECDHTTVGAFEAQTQLESSNDSETSITQEDIPEPISQQHELHQRIKFHS
jgi:hypothetical protein